MEMDHQHSTERKAHHSDEVKLDIIRRLNKIEGQVRGVTKMVSEDHYCDSVLNQITSIESAMNSVRCLLLEQHIKSCVVDQLQEGKTEVVGELMATIGRMIR
jgi:CsoR family transcriptional regulator, copper-sensing transcriptional repressor